jgi:quinol monooxygenase YgiN
LPGENPRNETATGRALAAGRGVRPPAVVACRDGSWGTADPLFLLFGRKSSFLRSATRQSVNTRPGQQLEYCSPHSRQQARHAMLIAALTFDVRPDKRTELVSAVTEVLSTMRWSSGCLGCRLLADCENPNLFVLTSEWDDRSYLEAHLGSPEFQILEGTSFLLRNGPSLLVDEVVARARIPKGRGR